MKVVLKLSYNGVLTIVLKVPVIINLFYLEKIQSHLPYVNKRENIISLLLMLHKFYLFIYLPTHWSQRGCVGVIDTM